tara:strand:- start:817 stop:1182 length:366 start_codon:yes stop_codon:yes gene_type:complete
MIEDKYTLEELAGMRAVAGRAIANGYNADPETQWGLRVDSSCAHVLGTRYIADFPGKGIHPVVEAHGRHIATFDPPTAIKLIDSLEAEKGHTAELCAEVKRLRAQVARLANEVEELQEAKS